MIASLTQMMDSIKSYQHEFHGMTVKIDNVGHPTNFRFQIFDDEGKRQASSPYSFVSRWNCEYAAEECILAFEG
jgi:hypothetical protein